MSELSANYDATGVALRALIEARLPADWSWQGKRLLDFGAGTGRVLRQFGDVADVAHLYGCDVESDMIAWATQHVRPGTIDFQLTGFYPPLPYPDNSFDVVTAFSVFTHLGANWADWLLELRRVLTPDGWLIATFLGDSCSHALTDVPYDPDSVGMSVFGFADPILPYVNVLHSEWWLREHWGRAFDIVYLVPATYSGSSQSAGVQGVVVMRPRAGSFEPDDLWLEAPGERRYAAAHRHQLELMRLEGERAKAVSQRTKALVASVLPARQLASVQRLASRLRPGR